MPDRSDVYKQVIKYFDSLRTNEQSYLRQKREEVYAACPRVRQIENEISILGITAAKNAIESKTPTQDIIELKEKMDSLKAEKIQVMKSAGFDPDCLNINYKCEKCQDTGFVGQRECSCFTQKLVEMAYSSSNMREITSDENFDNFNINYYSNETEEGAIMSPKENMQIILSVCLEFTKNFSKKKDNLLFYGGPGLGKTFLCSCIAREILDKGYTVFYATAPQLFKTIEKERFSRSQDEESQTGFSDDLQSVDLLIIDDLGTEFSTAFTSSELFDILNTRLINKKPVIISTNLSVSELQNLYSERITSRIIGQYKVMKFFGKDIRLIKKYSYK